MGSPHHVLCTPPLPPPTFRRRLLATLQRPAELVMASRNTCALRCPAHLRGRLHHSCPDRIALHAGAMGLHGRHRPEDYEYRVDASERHHRQRAIAGPDQDESLVPGRTELPLDIKPVAAWRRARFCFAFQTATGR
jgi:hypothetical protein